ncbi:MAG TPA: hypothetical protein VMT87_05970 [Vicinamibacteria bacterium]|nr:hypothetical protein [Vicinamibacteria bacterium]
MPGHQPDYSPAGRGARSDLFADPRHLEAARADFDRRREGVTYAPRIGDRQPALDYRK